MARHPRLGALERALYAIIRTGPWPTHTDLEGVILALSRVQFTYRLDPVDMANGEIITVSAIGSIVRYVLREILMWAYFFCRFLFVISMSIQWT